MVNGMIHDRPPEELLEQLVLYALELPDESRSELEVHLETGCAACADEIASLRESFSAVGASAPLHLPRPELRRRVMGAIALKAEPATQVWKAWTETPGTDLHVVRGPEGEWETVRAGVHAKRLYVDVSQRNVTMLVRMDAGAKYIPHRHAGPEQCFVLEGDLHEGQDSFYAGDFQCAAAGSVHGEQWTEAGCLLLIVSSLHDELLAGSS